MKIKKNDTVLVVTGKDAGKVGKVLEVKPTEKRVVVDGVNVQKKHKKPRNAQDQGGIIDQLGAIDASNVMVICPKCNKAVRVAYKEEDGKKIRYCKKCNASLDAAPAAVKEAKKVAAKKTAKKAEAVEEAPAKKTAKKTTKTTAAKKSKKTETVAE